MMTTNASSLETVNTPCTLIAHETLRQLIYVNRPEELVGKKEAKSLIKI